MGKRTEVLWRLFAVLWAWTVGALVMTIATPVGMVFGVLDLLWQLIAGSEGLSDSNIGFRIFVGSLMWIQGLMVFGFTGGGDGFQWVPSI